MWTRFHDLEVGNTRVSQYQDIYIEADYSDSVRWLKENLNINAEHRCRNCGPDYQITQYDTLEQATGQARGCAHAYSGNRIQFFESGQPVPEEWTVLRWSSDYLSLSEYRQRPDVLIVQA